MNPSKDGCEELSDWYNQKQGETGDLDGVGFQEVPLHLVIEAVRL